MTIIKTARPPTDLTSYVGRKWLESLVDHNTVVGTFTDLSFLLINSDALAPNARKLIASGDITITDTGPGGTIAPSLTNTGIAPGTFTKLTVDIHGRATAGTSATTTDVSEGANLYFTDARAIAAVIGSGTFIAVNGTSVTTASIPFAEGLSVADTKKIEFGDPGCYISGDSTLGGLVLSAQGGAGFTEMFCRADALMEFDANNNITFSADGGNYTLEMGPIGFNFTCFGGQPVQINGNLLVGADLQFNVDHISDVGSDTKRPKLIHIGGSVGGAINTAFRGLKLIGAGADFYIGDDNVSPGYYAQRAVVSGSTVSDYSQDYSNLFQGDSAYQYLALNFGITRSLGSNGVVIGDNGIGEGCSLIIGTSTTRRMEMYFDWANKTFVMDGNLTSGTAANKCMKVKLELGATAPTFYPATDNKIDLGITATNRWKGIYSMTAQLSTSLTMDDAANIIVNTTTGTKIGTGTTQKLGFYNAAPIAQRSGAAQAAVGTTAATNVAPYGYTTAAQADAIVTLVNELRAWAVAQGFIKGSA